MSINIDNDADPQPSRNFMASYNKGYFGTEKQKEKTEKLFEIARNYDEPRANEELFDRLEKADDNESTLKLFMIAFKELRDLKREHGLLQPAKSTVKADTPSV